MTKGDYLSIDSVQEFAQWAASRLDQPGSLHHHYYHVKNKVNWQCDSLYSAFINYTWAGLEFIETECKLDSYKRRIRLAVDEADKFAAEHCCLDILGWGRVSYRNSDRIKAYGDALVPYLREAARLLHPDHASTADEHKHIVMNSGFTKIYSLLLDDFVIYDSRVGAALGMLVLKFCQETNKTATPQELKFAYGNAKGSAARRNPSYGLYSFTPLQGVSNNKTHIVHNLRANWLLKEVLVKTNSSFSSLREIEAALFMIGYDISCAKKTVVRC